MYSKGPTLSDLSECFMNMCLQAILERRNDCRLEIVCPFIATFVNFTKQTIEEMVKTKLHTTYFELICLEMGIVAIGRVVYLRTRPNDRVRKLNDVMNLTFDGHCKTGI